MKLSVVILAGGRSRRMGQDKAWLPWRGLPLLAHQIQTAKAIHPAEILISGRPDADYGAMSCAVVYDEFVNRGPLAGIARALQAICTPLLLVLAVDLPLMEASFLRRMADLCGESIGLVPQVNGGIEPLAAFYPKASHQISLDLLARRSTAVAHFARCCVQAGLARWHKVAPAEARLFANWNRPGDLAAP